MSKDIVKIKKHKSTNGLYNPWSPVLEGFKIDADFLSITPRNTLLAMQKGSHALTTSEIKKMKVNTEKFTVKIYTQNSIYKLKFKAKEKSELFQEFV